MIKFIKGSGVLKYAEYDDYADETWKTEALWYS